MSAQIARVYNWLSSRSGSSGGSGSHGISNLNYGLYADQDDDDEDEHEILDEDEEDVQAPDGSGHGSVDGRRSFFQKGREYESTFVNHRYTEKELRVLASYETLDYLPPDSVVYRRWLGTQATKWDWDRFLVMGLIGFCVGLVGFLLHQLIDLIAETKWKYATDLVKDNVFLCWLWIFG